MWLACLLAVAAISMRPAEAEVLERYCYECHNVHDWAGGLAIDLLSPVSEGQDGAAWENVVRKLRGGLMPPPGSPRPAREEAIQLVRELEAQLDEVWAGAPDPGRVTVHRLNRSEYAATVYSLFGVRVDERDILPADIKTEGFDNVASVLGVSPSFFSQYLAAARTVANLVMGEPGARPTSVFYPSPGGGQTSHRDGMPLGTRGGMLIEHSFPADGTYRFGVQELGVGLYNEAVEHAHTLILTVDDREVFRASLGGKDDLDLVDHQQAAGREAIQARFENIELEVNAGLRRVGVTFVQRSRAESEDVHYSFDPVGGMDRIPRVRGGVEITGPFDAAGVSSTLGRSRVLVCEPMSPEEETPCVEKILKALLPRAIRRSVNRDDVEGFMAFYTGERRRGGSFHDGVTAVLTGVLSSPDFLFRTVPLEDSAESGAVHEIDAYALASRLSFFLWSAGPDERLLSLAADRRLGSPEVLRGEVRRMLSDPRSGALVRNFAHKWLRLDDMEAVEPDPNLFPHFDRALRDALLTETELFLDSVLRGDRSVTDLLDASHTYLNERLARHYGVGGVHGARFRRVELELPERWGLLGKGAVLLTTSYGNRTSPVVRGAWILDNLLGAPPAPPPPDVETDLSDPEEGVAQTVRARLEEHRESPSCSGCHGVIDPLGLALENFDVTGEWRDIDRYARIEIDAAGELADGTSVAGPVELREALVRDREQFAMALTEKLMMYALGRTVEYHDMPSVREIVRGARESNYRFSDILFGIASSPAFTRQTVPARVNEEVHALMQAHPLLERE